MWQLQILCGICSVSDTHLIAITLTRWFCESGGSQQTWNGLGAFMGSVTKARFGQKDEKQC